jgi:hypothetical protein
LDAATAKEIGDPGVSLSLSEPGKRVVRTSTGFHGDGLNRQKSPGSHCGASATVANWPQASMVLHLLVHLNDSASVNSIRADSVLILWKHGVHSVQGPESQTVTSPVPNTAGNGGHSWLLEAALSFACKETA